MAYDNHNSNGKKERGYLGAPKGHKPKYLSIPFTPPLKKLSRKNMERKTEMIGKKGVKEHYGKGRMKNSKKNSEYYKRMMKMMDK